MPDSQIRKTHIQNSTEFLQINKKKTKYPIKNWPPKSILSMCFMEKHIYKANKVHENFSVPLIIRKCTAGRLAVSGQWSW